MLWNTLTSEASSVAQLVNAVVTGGFAMFAQTLQNLGLGLGAALLLYPLISGLVAAGVSIGTITLSLTDIGLLMAMADGYYGNNGIDITVPYGVSPGGLIVSGPTVSQQEGYWENGRTICEHLSTACYFDRIPQLFETITGVR
ncbi:MAG TPA: hypothetical protein VFU22_30835, partial [Roseiflexaceae bacterium]|nr:hypothetical protein [Roseiflexaceae bacterium]